MSEIQSKLDSLQPYINGIRYVSGLQVVDALFKEGWVVPESDVIKKELVDKETNYYMFYTEKEEVTFDDLLEYVEGIITINIEKEKKNELFKAKVSELRSLFKETSLSILDTLKFKITEPDLTPSLDDEDISLDDEIEIPVNEPVSQEEVAIPPKGTVHSGNQAPIELPDNTRKVKGQEIELPPRDEKIVVEEFTSNVVCKCGPDDVCPVCEEEKFG